MWDRNARHDQRHTTELAEWYRHEHLHGIAISRHTGMHQPQFCWSPFSSTDILWQLLVAGRRNPSGQSDRGEKPGNQLLHNAVRSKRCVSRVPTCLKTQNLRAWGSYYGGLTVKLQNSVSVKVANTELVVPDTYIAANGAVQTNTSVRNVVVNSLQTDNGNDMPVLGRLFMSSAYVMVNHDAGRFSVWQANTASRTTDIVALDKQNNVVNQFCTDSSPKALPPNSSESPPPLPEEKSTLSRGSIAGIAVGSAAGLAMLCGIGFVLYRRRRSSSPRTDETPEQEPESQKVDIKSPTYSMVTVEPQELPVQYDAAELDGRTLDSRR